MEFFEFDLSELAPCQVEGLPSLSFRAGHPRFDSGFIASGSLRQHNIIAKGARKIA